MEHLTNKLPIETWKKIAYMVQKLEFSNYGDEEFEKNLKILKSLLENAKLYFRKGSRYPQYKQEVGLATLLQEIYRMNNLKERANKSLFYEQIYTLSDLGIQEIDYCPVNFYTQILDMKKVYYYKQGKTVYDKAFTDGIFVLETIPIVSKNKRTTYYNMENLRNANFILNILLEKQQSSVGKSEIILQEASASLKNFKGQFPCKEEILKDDFPKVMIPQQLTIFDGKITKLKEIYIPSSSSELSCARRLVKSPTSNSQLRDVRK